MPLRRSRVLDKLREGKTVGCTKLNLGDPRVVEIAALCGIDSVWLDLEHVPNTLQTIENQVRAARAYGADAIVRVPRGSYSDLLYPLEMDAAGIMIPHVRTAEEAEQLVHRTRFHPLGRRPLDGGNADAAFCGAGMAEYTKHANEHRMVIVQIEDPEAMEQLDAIAAVQGIDMLFFGPGDFSQGLGVPGQLDDPKIHQARKVVADAAHHHGKFAGTVAAPRDVDRYRELGYQFISVGADVVALRQQFTDTAKLFSDASSEHRDTGSPYETRRD